MVGARGFDFIEPFLLDSIRVTPSFFEIIWTRSGKLFHPVPLRCCPDVIPAKESARERGCRSRSWHSELSYPPPEAHRSHTGQRGAIERAFGLAHFAGQYLRLFAGSRYDGQEQLYILNRPMKSIDETLRRRVVSMLIYCLPTERREPCKGLQKL